MRSIEKLKGIARAYHAIDLYNENSGDMIYRDKAKDAEKFLWRNGTDSEYAKVVYSCVINDIETIEEYIKLFPYMFEKGERTAELINFAIELERHEIYMILLEFARNNGIDLKPKLAL